MGTSTGTRPGDPPNQTIRWNRRGRCRAVGDCGSPRTAAVNAALKVENTMYSQLQCGQGHVMYMYASTVCVDDNGYRSASGRASEARAVFSAENFDQLRSSLPERGLWISDGIHCFRKRPKARSSAVDAAAKTWLLGMYSTDDF